MTPASLGLIGPIGWTELIIVLFVVLLLFGPKRLPQMGRAIGDTVKELRKSAEGRDDDVKEGEKSTDESE